MDPGGLSVRSGDDGAAALDDVDTSLPAVLHN